MSYFFRDDCYRHRQADRPQGVRNGEPVTAYTEPENAPMTRTSYIEEAIQQMQPDGTGYFHFKSKEHLPSKGRGGPKQPVSARTTAGEAFRMDGKPDTPPQMRVRVGVSDEELQKIWAEDDRKHLVANKMAQGPTMVDKMIDYHYPLPHPNEVRPPKRGDAHLQRDTTERTEPHGFKGMGAYSHPEHNRGTAAPRNDFEPPTLQLKPRGAGRRYANQPKSEFQLA